MELQKSSLVQVERDVSRPLADFPAGNGEDPFIISCISHMDHKAREIYKEKLCSLKEHVKELYTATKANPVENVEFIYTLCRLGVCYHFEKEIEEQLDKLFDSNDFHSILRDDECDLYTTGLAFQLFRQFGFKLSPDVFEKFKDGDGKFKEHLGADTKAILSLYEAAQWSTRGEDVLDDALVFSTSRLEGLLASRYIRPHLAVRIKNVLKHSYHKGIPRLESRQYISYYEEDEIHDETLLTFSKVDFNLVQLLHREELAHISRWYKDMKIKSGIPYARNRMVEAYMWAVALNFVPRYSQARIINAISTILVTLLDDTYDAYGTLEELDLFTDALDRLEKELENEGMSGCSFNVKNKFKELAKSYYREAKWLNEDYVATFDEYAENGETTSTCSLLLAATYVGVPDIDKREAFQWLSSKPKIIGAAVKIWRFMDDIVGHEMDHKRKHVKTTIDCYMKQYDVSKEKAKEEIERIISESWKDMNQELMRPYSAPYHLLQHILNLTRACEVTYKYHEGYTQPHHLKDCIVALFAQQIPI
ncbi:PREDICTED: alpha-humulene/(-)-(E)-beta-caryophyllene synthase-like isoform X2 [Tarenaya hassleriana]|uniref:alpha-humulene/(-)-(E)-beta-caryophyllene synthase-like isoform X2 n=1 Tax=Tarenaya hassleriana TaxID=28532 RepID=UPI00053C904C|nr:PREDICTED: alpha-humulene/(-)-(E)-beta-caryophyllene synthase-like isoform X2 [Tarenaya hassleriana]